jgi:L-ribulose-5-phosphate 4-epimerase
MLEALKNKVLMQIIELVRQGLVIYTWGNVSAIDRSSGLCSHKTQRSKL